MIHKYQPWIVLGSLFLFLGLQLRAVDTFVLRPSATRLLNDWFGPPKESAQGIVRDIALQSDTIAYHQITPPVWLGWALLCCGVVMLSHGLIRWKSKS